MENKEIIPDVDEERKHSSKRVKYISYARQVICSLIVSCGLFHTAFTISSTSMLPQILNEGNPGANYTSVDLKWLASGGAIIGIVGNLISCYISTLIGPRLVFRWAQAPGLAFYLLMAFFPTFEAVLVSRLGIGVIMGICEVIIVSLIAELTEPNLRGFTSALSDVIYSLATLCSFVAFAFLSEKVAILCMSIPLCIGFLGSFLVPESPLWLMKKGKTDEATRAVRQMIGNDREEEVIHNFLPLISVHQKDHEYTVKTQMLLLRKKQNLKPIGQAMMAFIFKEIGGNSAIFYYALFIFQLANPALDAFVCTILLGTIRFVATAASSVFHDRIGRRPMLIGTFFVAGVASFVGGLFLYGEFAFSKWVPLGSLLVFVAMNGIGTGPIPWILVGELVPSCVRLLGFSIVISTYYISQFSIVAIIPILASTISLGPCLMMFGVIDVLGSFMLWVFLPETKRKSLKEIELDFNKKNSGKNMNPS